MQVNGGYEYWGRAAALIHSSVDGTRDIAPLSDERVYLIASAQHYDVPLPRRIEPGSASNGSPIDAGVVQRALLVDLLHWVHDGDAPPPSRVPTLAAHTLVPLADFAFPELRGLPAPKVAQRAYHADYGPRFAQGIVDIEPPKLGAAFPTLVPTVDRFGNQLGGITGIELRVPLATYAPWHLSPLFPGEPEPFQGSFLPLPRDDDDGAQHHDPRPSIASLYRDRADFLAQVDAAAKAMVEERVLLPCDVARVRDRAAACWDMLAPR
ncbi:MAG: alpha/beta hydrolase domain-containing protein [Planctomycetota bacterium]